MGGACIWASQLRTDTSEPEDRPILRPEATAVGAEGNNMSVGRAPGPWDCGEFLLLFVYLFLLLLIYSFGSLCSEQILLCD